jgi:hypothetical protein
MGMASSKALNAHNLETLGATRLAALLIEISTGSAVAKRRLRLELAGASGADDAAHEVRKRLASIARARTFIDWQKTKALVTDLEAQRGAIVDHVAKTDPGEALALMWRLLCLAEPIFARCDDGSGRMVAMFKNAVESLGPIVDAAKPKPASLAASAFEALQISNHGQWDDLIATLAPYLGTTGLDMLSQRIVAWVDEPAGETGDGNAHTRRAEAFRRASIGRFALEQIADAKGDVDAYAALQSTEARTVPKVAAAIGRRLLAAGRASDALAAVDAADLTNRDWVPAEWQAIRLDILEALGRTVEAQDFRWHLFSTHLSVEHLRAYLRKLPAFDDFDAEQRALSYASGLPHIHRAAAFLVAWPALDRASRLILARTEELDGDLYEVLTPLAEALAESYPLAATLALRAMIDSTLDRGRSTRYGYARQHLAECAALSHRIEDFGEFADHAAYEAQLRAKHGRKFGFWGTDAPW